MDERAGRYRIGRRRLENNRLQSSDRRSILILRSDRNYRRMVVMEIPRNQYVTACVRNFEFTARAVRGLGSSNPMILNNLATTRTAISTLFLHSGPFAIAWFVVAAVVYTIYRECGFWFWSHIGQEVCERMHPLFADFNATTTVPLVIRRICFGAANFYIAPSGIFRGPFSSFSMSVSSGSFFSEFSFQASTTFLVPIYEA